MVMTQMFRGTLQGKLEKKRGERASGVTTHSEPRIHGGKRLLLDSSSGHNLTGPRPAPEHQPMKEIETWGGENIIILMILLRHLGHVKRASWRRVQCNWS